MVANFHETFIKVKDIAVIIILPILFTALFGYLYSNIYVQDIPFAILDLDETTSSRMIIDSFADSKGLDVIGTVSSQTELEDKILSREVYGGLIIPDDFEKNVKAKQSPTLLVWIDGSNIVIGNNIYAYSSTIINMLGVGVQMSYLQGGGIVPYTAEQYLTTMSFTDRMLFDPQMGYMRYIFAGILGIMIQQTYLSVLSSRLLQAKDKAAQLTAGYAQSSWTASQSMQTAGAGNRLSSENPEKSCIFGKMGKTDKIPVHFPTIDLLCSIVRLLLLSTISFFLCLLTANRLFSYPLRGDTPELLALVLLFLVNMTAMSLVITSLFDNEAHCAQFCMFLSVPTFLTSGYVWPEFMMAPHFASIIKSIWPLYYLVNPLRDVCMKEAGFGDITPYLIQGALFALAWLTVSVLLFRFRIRLKAEHIALESAHSV